MVKYNSYVERGNLLLPHGLLFPISSKQSFIHTIPQTGQYKLWPLLHQLWSTGWNEKQLKDQVSNLLYHELILISSKESLTCIISKTGYFVVLEEFIVELLYALSQRPKSTNQMSTLRWFDPALQAAQTSVLPTEPNLTMTFN